MDCFTVRCTAAVTVSSLTTIFLLYQTMVGDVSQRSILDWEVRCRDGQYQ
jgi:hypothetical protein